MPASANTWQNEEVNSGSQAAEPLHMTGILFCFFSALNLEFFSGKKKGAIGKHDFIVYTVLRLI